MARHDSPIADLPVSDEVKGFLTRGPRMVIGDAMIGGDEIPFVDPATGIALSATPEATLEQVDRAVTAARAQMDDGPWQRMSPYERQRRLFRLADLIERDADALAELETVNSGKLIGVARAIEIGASIEYARYMAGWATKIEGTTLQPSIPPFGGKQWRASTYREPIGVVGAITPWNFPFMMAMWKVMPALACGNAIVVKPPEDAPLTTLRLAELALEADIPAGVFSAVTGRGPTVGAALASHSGIDKLTFTGSTKTGRLIAHVAAERIVPVTLELGGKSPVIVLGDCDPQVAAEGAAAAIFLHQGQTCVAGSRVYVERRIYAAVVERLAAIAEQLRVGAPMDPKTQIGPVQSRTQQERVLSYIDSGIREGARVAAGGKPVDRPGFYVAPTVLADAGQDMRVVREEIFGPVLTVMPFDTIDEVVSLANDSDYGLAASIWSNDLSRVQRLIPRIKAGTVWVNAHAILDPGMPHGGYKQSGIGREHGRTLIDHYTQTKTVCMAV